MFKRLSLIVIVVSLFALPVLAQDATASPPEATPAATEVVAPGSSVTINNYPTSDPSVTPAPNESPVSLALLLIGSFLVGGITVGTPLIYIITHLTKDQKDTAEKLFLSQPPANIEKERAALALVDKALDIFGRVMMVAKELTDGLPNTDVPDSGSNSG